MISLITISHCFKDLEQSQKCSPSFPDPVPLTRKNKHDEDEVLLIFVKLTFFLANPLGLQSEKKMFLMPKTLINLLLLNPNNLTHWSRERPICLLGGSASLSAGADSVIRDDGRGGK